MDFKLNDTEINLENKIMRIGDKYMIGSIAACFTTLAFVPQAIKVIKTKDTAGISLEMYIMSVTGVLLWAIHGLRIQDMALIVANSITFVLSLIILVCKIRYK